MSNQSALTTIKKVILYLVLAGSTALVEFYFAWTSHIITDLQTGKNVQVNPTVINPFG
jgi:hypothetical protein